MYVFPRALWVGFLAALLLAMPSPGQVVISEFMASNVTTSIRDEDGNREDWIELQNNGSSPVSLNGWYLTDDVADKRKWQFPLTTPSLSLAPGARILVWASDKRRIAAADRLHTNFKLGADGEYLALVRADGVTVEFEFAPKYPPQADDVSYGFGGTKRWSTVVGPSLASQWRIKVPQSITEFTGTMAGWNNSLTFDDATWTLAGTSVSGTGIPLGIGYDRSGESSYLIQTASPSGNVESLLYKPNDTTWSPGAPNLCARIKFNVSDPTQVDLMRLNIRFDDGFIVYLNGTKIFENNAPATPAFNSAAPIDREDDELEGFETFALPLGPGGLIAGQNLLTIHAFNEATVGSRASASFHLTPQLEVFATTTSGGAGLLGYLSGPTPRTENASANPAIGPTISQTTKNPPQPVGGSGSAPLLITSRVRQTLHPISSVICHYLINFAASEAQLVMRDDGTLGDVAAGDGIYSAQIPTTGMAAGHLVRWRVVARDNATSANVTINPPFRDAADNEQYFGTIAQTPGVQSNLPVLYWYHNSGSTGAVFATNKTGFRSSFFYKLPTESFGRYYDNVRVTLHGQSTAGFNKKSQNIGFNEDNRFYWRQGEKEVRSMNLLSNWADKSKIRNQLAWEIWNDIGHPSHWAQPIRVQQITAATINDSADAQFMTITDMVEDGNKEFLERWGLDGDGALYKVYNSLTDTSQTSSTNGAGVEKKTREFEDFKDLQALVDALADNVSVTERRRWVYDNVDVPAMINYIAVHNVIQSHDYGHKNYYIYRDTNGTKEWKLLPWDQDLSFGHRWTSAQNYFDDDIDSANSIMLGGGGNRLMRMISTSGTTELTQMYVRRLRTLMDRYLGRTSAPVSHIVDRIDAMQDVMDPPAWPTLTDAERDFRKWGFWTDGNGGTTPWTDPAAVHHRLRPYALRIKSQNNTSIYPGANPYTAYGGTTNLHTSMEAWLPGRRKYLYNENGLNPSLNGQGIPSAQTGTFSLVIEQVNANVAGSTDQEGEYFVVKNNSTTEAVDLSDWTITGAINFKFPPGTVIPRQGTTTSDGGSSNYVNQIVIAKNPVRLRARATSPKASEFRLVIGGYDNQLSARGGTLQLKNLAGAVIASNTYAGAPTAAQQSLRITEVNYAPTPPSASELLAIPGLQASDFEFIELVNSGATSLPLGNAHFDKGITFIFPPGYSLGAGERAVIVAHSGAYGLRHQNTSNVVGQFVGNLDNAGERIRILDGVGEVVLDFTYSPAWYPPTSSGGGYTLVTRTSNPAYDAYDAPTNWAISGSQGGTPGAADTTFSETFEGWRHDFFSLAEQSLPTTAVAADFEGDDQTNVAEYAYGRDPKAPATAPPATSGFVNVSGADYMTLTFVRRKKALDLSYTVEASSNLLNWTPTSLMVGAPVDAGVGLETVTYRDVEPRSTLPRYMRVRASKF